MSSTLSARYSLKQAIFTNEPSVFALCGSIRYHLGNVTVMVRNAGQLPQPFWLGAACGGGSCSAARCAARTRPTADDQSHQKRTAWEGGP